MIDLFYYLSIKLVQQALNVAMGCFREFIYQGGRNAGRGVLGGKGTTRRHVVQFCTRTGHRAKIMSNFAKCMTAARRDGNISTVTSQGRSRMR